MITKIIIAEDNTSTFSCYQELLSKDKSIEIIGYVQDGESAIYMYKEKNPDLLILDLNIPKKNGIEVLEELSLYEGTNPKCNVLVITGDLDLLQKLSRTKKVFGIIPKPFSYQLVNKLIEEYKKEQIANTFSESQCAELLLQLNINPYSRNGRLLCEAIEMCYCDYHLLDSMKDLYFSLSCRKLCSPRKIESSLRCVVNTANKGTSFEKLNSIFFTETIDPRENISTKKFINGLIVYLNHQKECV